MPVIRHESPFRRRPSHKPLLAAVLVASLIVAGSAHAAKFGHSRLVSTVGEPLRVSIPVTQLSAADASTLRVEPAPASEWASTGLTPPVDLGTLQARLIDGHTSGSRVLQVWSDQVFDRPIADLLLDIHTSSGVQRYQVSLLARGGASAIHAPVEHSRETPSTRRPTVSSSDSFLAQKPVLIRQGDTMFAVAQRHAVSGVSVYQMMIALLRANPHAFIHENLNLVRTDAQLSMPDMAALTAISDREARRLFHEQVLAFNLYRKAPGGFPSDDAVTANQALVRSDQESEPVKPVTNVPESRVGARDGDQLKLSHAPATTELRPDGTVAHPSDSAQDATPAGQISRAENRTGNTAQSGTSSLTPAAHAATTASTASTESTSVESPSSETLSTAPGSDVSVSEKDYPDADDAVADDQDTRQAPVTNQASHSESGATPLPNDGAQADDDLATRKAIDDAQSRVSQLEENVKNLNRALQFQGEAAKDLVVDGAIGLRQSLTDVATAVTDATIGDEEPDEITGEGVKADVASPDAMSSTSLQGLEDDTTSTVTRLVDWLQAHLLAVITAVLAFIVLLTAWVLRRANIAQSSTERVITPEMVKEKLDQINLDLDEPTVDDPSSSRT